MFMLRCTSSLQASSNYWARRTCSSLPSWSFRLLSNLERLLLADDNVVSAEQFLQNSINSKADFVRLIDRGDVGAGGGGGGFSSCELQTALVSFRRGTDNNFLPFGSPLLHQKPFLLVDLVSTIHIADKRYFETLQKELEPYDCVLYEMVASRESLENTRQSAPKKKLRGSGTHGYDTEEGIQRQIAGFLKLDFQLDCLDYQAENWFHADVDLETYDLLKQGEGEIPRDKMPRWTKAIVQATSIPDVGPLISQESYCATIKVFLAKLLKSELSEVTTGVEEISLINGERNRAAIEALRRAIDEGHKKIAILYGVGHMPDLGWHLREEFNLAPSQVQWITAWSMGNYNLKTAQEMDLWLSELFSGAIINKLSHVAFNHLSQSHGSEKLGEFLLKHVEEQRKRKAIEPCSETQAKMNAIETELSKIVGLNELKLQIRKWAKGMLLNERRQALGLKVSSRRSPHMAFLGNPGTGKTMVARVLGKLLHMVGILPTDKVTEVQRTDLVGRYVGETGPKTRKKIKGAEGGILFVDEAYRLIPSQQAPNEDYGIEALEEIMSVMDKGEVVVIFAGYSEPMKQVISANAGFRRRVTKFFYFDNFSSEDIARILHLKMTNQAENSLLYGFKLHSSCSINAIAALIQRETTEKQREEMNGGLADPLLVNARENLDSRLNFDCTDTDELRTITLKDLEVGIRLLPKRAVTSNSRTPPSRLHWFIEKYFLN